MASMDDVNNELMVAFGEAAADDTQWADIDEPEVEYVDMHESTFTVVERPAHRGDWRILDAFLRCVA